MRLLPAALAALLIANPALRTSAAVAPQDALGLMRTLRAGGCGGHGGTAAALHVNRALNGAASQWSHGATLTTAIAGSGYRDDQSTGLHVSGDAQAVRQALSQRLCSALTDASMVDTGILQRGNDLWIIVAAPFAVPPAAAAASVAGDVLKLVNAARATARHCGRSAYPAAPPLRLNPLLTRAAQAHAEDMLRYGYFDHTGHDGSTPARRVAATGYGYRIVGENLASGPESAQEAVQGWLASPGHCQNIMDARFAELGAAFAASRSGEPRIYWVQEFALPR
jgi:uncharacterized protein YkwD